MFITNCIVMLLIFHNELLLDWKTWVYLTMISDFFWFLIKIFWFLIFDHDFLEKAVNLKYDHSFEER